MGPDSCIVCGGEGEGDGTGERGVVGVLPVTRKRECALGLTARESTGRVQSGEWALAFVTAEVSTKLRSLHRIY